MALAEVMWVLESVYDLSASDQAQAIVHDHEAVLAALELFRSRPSLGFSDCLILESARKAGHLPLGTFDRGLARIDGTHKR